MTSIQPELWVERAGQAVAFYADAFGAVDFTFDLPIERLFQFSFGSPTFYGL